VIAVLDESDSEAIESALKVGVSGFLARTSPVSQIVSALITTATGGIALSPSVMNKIIGIGAGRNLSNSSQNVTKREVDILRLLADGRSVKEIADKLSISYYTVDTHIRNLHRKLPVKNSRGLITVAMRRRLI
jgi:DNA-binding NarL/FixJ family response regulator